MDKMKKTALLFPGQGSQYVGMGKVLCEKNKIAMATFEEASEAIGVDLKALCFEADIAELTKTENTQPAVLTASVAAYRTFLELDVEPSFFAGHSLGEITALTCSGVIEFSDAVKIVKNRGRFMQEAVPKGIGSMAAIINADEEAIKKACELYTDNNSLVVISNLNLPDQIVISGHTGAVNNVIDYLAKQDASASLLNVSAPFHCPLMKPAADRFREYLSKYQFKPMKYPVISNLTALPYESHDAIIKTLSAQLISPVYWYNSIKYMESNGVEMAVELGPGEVLVNMMRKNVKAIKFFSFDNEDDNRTLKVAMSKDYIDDVNENKPLKLMTMCLAITVCTKNNNWGNDEYTKGVIEPYRDLQKLCDELENAKKEPTTQQMEEALLTLEKVFETKHTPMEERIARYNEIFQKTGLKDIIGDIGLPA